MKAKFTINDREIGSGFSPYIIAELSANHNGSFENAKRIIQKAKIAGADAVKLQTYTADKLTLDNNSEEFMIRGGLWDGKSLYELYQEASMPWEWHEPLFKEAKKIGITIFSSPFDTTAADLLADLNAPAYKIASFEAIDLPLIKYVAGIGKPMIISTGMANDEEISEAIAAAHDGGCKEVAILHCVSGYPALPEEYNLKTIADMIKRFGLVSGLSDHTLDNTTAITSVAMGASIIEKHFTLDRDAGGPDDSFSLEPQELAQLCVDARTAWSALGGVNYGRTNSELPNVKFRRSLYYKETLKKGTVLSGSHFRSVRPGYGLPPKYSEVILGKTLLVDVSAHTPVSLGHFEIL